MLGIEAVESIINCQTEVAAELMKMGNCRLEAEDMWLGIHSCPCAWRDFIERGKNPRESEARLCGVTGQGWVA